MVSIDKIERGVARFLDAEMLPTLPTEGVARVVAGTAMAVLVRRLGGMIRGYANHSIVRGLGVIDESGNVDVDILREALKANVPETGLKIEIPLGGAVTFHKADVDLLYRYILE
jgi:hypothetical protein